jgi:nucleotide-binding universal stress UspA family protein
MFRKVIWATDGSAHADRAMDTAVQVAQDDGAELHVVHIVEKLLSGRASGMDAYADEDMIKAKVEQQAEAIAGEVGIDASTHLSVGVSGRIGDRIAEIAQDVGADLIVVGTRGHGAIGSMVLGGVTQRLLRVSPCPVLAVPSRASVQAAEPTEPAVTAG